MVLPAPSDIEARIERTLSATETTRVQALIDDALGLVALHSGRAVTDPLPDGVSTLVIGAVLRVWDNPRGHIFQGNPNAGGTASFPAGLTPDTRPRFTREERRQIKAAYQRSTTGGRAASVRMIPAAIPPPRWSPW